MATSWTEGRRVFKSPLRTVVRFVCRSRDLKAEKCGSLKKELVEANRWLDRCQLELDRKAAKVGELRQQVQRLECTIQQSDKQLCLPADPPVGTHGYGARMVCLSVALAQAVGFRGAERVLRIVFEWLGIEQKLPNYSTIRVWFQRVGLAIIKEPLEKADDWVWLADHSNQIGPEKVMGVFAIRASQLPEMGTPLKHEDVDVLTVQPGTTWKKEDVAEVYGELAKRYGAPRVVLMDGAAELREGAEPLKKQRSDTITLQDFKHKAANLFKALISHDPRFIEFNRQLGTTRSAIQQTELAHLTPPSLKQKARFMNLGCQLEWARVVLALLEHPEAQSHQWITPERLENKLGWLREFAVDLAGWSECQRVVNTGLKQINEQGLFRGTVHQFRSNIGNLKSALSQRLSEQLIEFLTDAESQLKEGERLPLSTEILESSFALYKQLERQHSKGGFTSLLASFAALLRKPTPELVRSSFAHISTKEVKQWVRENLGTTLNSKRLATYREMKKLTTECAKISVLST
jgi:hypothetical protein